MEIMIFVAIVVFLAIWTVMAGVGLKAVFRITSWLDRQTLSVSQRTDYDYKRSSEPSHKPSTGRETKVSDLDEERALQEEVALKTALNRDINYDDVESSLGNLGEEIVEADNSMDTVEKLRKIQHDT